MFGKLLEATQKVTESPATGPDNVLSVVTADGSDYRVIVGARGGDIPDKGEIVKLLGVPEAAADELIKRFQEMFQVQAKDAHPDDEDADFAYAEAELGEAVGVVATSDWKPNEHDLDEVYGILAWGVEPVKTEAGGYPKYLTAWVAGV